MTGGRNTGRVGIVVSRERHPGSFDIVHIKDNADSTVCYSLCYLNYFSINSNIYLCMYVCVCVCACMYTNLSYLYMC